MIRVTMWRALLVVVGGYALASVGMWFMLHYIAELQGHDAGRPRQCGIAFAVLCAGLCLESVVAILRSRSVRR